jgi:hypothetical protein
MLIKSKVARRRARAKPLLLDYKGTLGRNAVMNGGKHASDVSASETTQAGFRGFTEVLIFKFAIPSLKEAPIAYRALLLDISRSDIRCVVFDSLRLSARYL